MSGTPRETFWAGLPLGRAVALLARDPNGLAALDKPAGVLSHPNAAGEEGRSLLDAAYRLDGEYYEWKSPDGEVRRLWLLNRLDSATSGVILVAAGEALAAAVRAHFKRREVHKVYNALVFGRPKAAEETWADKLAVKKEAGRVRTATGHMPSESRMSVVRSGPKTTLLRLEPLTGRSHQLRVQCAERRLPIVGDRTYGDFPRNKAFAKATGLKRLFLHSLEVRFTYELAGKTFSFAARAPLPPDFDSASPSPR